jgi:non-heme chloroperoxidase
MGAITTKDGTQIYFKDRGQGPPVVFSHGWPLTADAREDQMLFLAARGYRCIAHDRRGHGRSSHLTIPFYGANRPGAKVSQGLRDSFWLQGMQAGLKNAYDCIRALSETDHTQDLRKFDIPTRFLHGDDDQIVPIGASALLAAKLVPGSTLKIYAGGDHGICSTQKDRVNADLLAFLKEPS